MKWSTLARNSVVALPLVASLASCAAMSNMLDSRGSTGLDRMDDLLGQVERVHVECEVSRLVLQDSVAALHTMVQPGFAGDARMAFEEFQAAIERSEDQAEELRRAMRPMQRTAEKTFTEWTEDLEDFTSPTMRGHSQARLDEAQARFAAVTEVVEPAALAYEALNAELRDHALFLEHDFNATSIAVIEGELQGLAQRTVELDQGLARCLTVTRDYVEEGALRGQLPVEQE